MKRRWALVCVAFVITTITFVRAAASQPPPVDLPPRVLVVEASATDDRVVQASRRVAAELESAGFRVAWTAEPVSPSPTPNALVNLARRHEASAVIVLTATPEDDQLRVIMARPGLAEPRDVRLPPGDDASALVAVRVSEALRAFMIERPLRPAPLEVTHERDGPAASAPPLLRWSIGLGAASSAYTSWPALTVSPAIRGGCTLGAVGVRLAASGLGTVARADTNAGEIAVDSTRASAEITVGRWSGSVHPYAAIGPGLVRHELTGKPKPGFEGHEHSVTTTYVSASVGALIDVSKRWGVAAELGGRSSAASPTLVSAGEDARRLGRAELSAWIGVVVALGAAR